MRDEKNTTVDRRDFLRKAGIGTVGAGATLTTPLMRPAHADSESDENSVRKPIVADQSRRPCPDKPAGSIAARSCAGPVLPAGLWLR